MKTILSILTGLAALLFLTLGAGFLFAPARLSAQFSVLASDLPGFATFRGDLAALFLTLAIFSVAGMFRRRWLAVPIVCLAAIILGRVASLLIDGRSAGNLQSMLLEIALLVILSIAAMTGDSGSGAKIVLGFATLAALLLGAAFLFQRPIGIELGRRNVDANLREQLIPSLPEGLHAGFCGSGSPLADQNRAGPCVFVIAAGRVYIVDSGDGSTRKLTLMGIPPGQIEAIFLTHFHSDHIGGLGEMMLQRWASAGHDQPVDVYGPQGVDSVVDGFNAAYKLDSGYRVAHHGAATVPPTGAGGVAKPFDLADGAAKIILDRDGLKITAFPVNHTPVIPAVGYRFDYRGRSVVISGDTAPSESLTKAAQGADILFHEGLQAEMVSVIRDAAVRNDRRIAAKIMSDIPSYHTTPEDAARIAERAGVRRLVLYHIIPALPAGYLQGAYLGDAPKLFHGPVTVARDGLLFSMPPSSTAFSIRELL